MTRSLQATVLLACCTASAQPPVLHWPLDESAGSLAACWGGPGGVLAGGTAWAPESGHHQGAARFDGVDDRIVLGPCDITSGSGGLTVSLWAKADFVTGMERVLIAKATGPAISDHVWSIAFVNGTALRFRLRAGGASRELTTPPSSLFGALWYHLVAVHDGAEMRLYLNGALMGSMAAPGTLGLHPQSPASLGALSTGAQAFSGWIDDVRIHDRPLTEPEIIELLFASMITGLPPDDHGLPLLLGDAVNAPSGCRRVRVMDPLGRELASRPVRAPATVDLAFLPAGHYLVCLEGDGGRHVLRLARP